MDQNILTEDAVVMLSGNFDMPVVMQIHNVKKLSPRLNDLFLNLTDGKVSTGAKFKNTQGIALQNYWIVAVIARFIANDKPIQILNLEVVSTLPKKMLGDPPISLRQYYERQTKQQESLYLEREPIKKIKLDSSNASTTLPTISVPINKSLNNYTNHRQTPPRNYKRYDTTQIDLSDSSKPLFSNPISGKARKLQLDQPEHEQNSNIISIKQQTAPKNIQKQDYKPQSNKQYSYIQDLKPDDNDWILLCKVTYLYIVECTGGKPALNFIIMDENNDQVQCVSYGETAAKYEEYLQKGKYYTFSGGVIALDKRQQHLVSSSGKREELQITFDRAANIILQNNCNFSYQTSKLSKIDQLFQKATNQQVNVIGIVKRVKPGQKSTNKNKMRNSVTICDPLTNYQLQLGLFLGKDDKEIRVGQLCVLHNFKVDKKGTVIKLQSGFRSYYTQGQDIHGPIKESLQKCLQTDSWNHQKYQSLSTLTLTRRTIKQLNQVLNSTSDPKLYSIIDCWLVEINEKNSYLACNICKRSTQTNYNGSFCYKCGSVVETFLCYTLSVVCSDFTASIKFDVIGQHAQSLLEIRAENYEKLSKQQKKKFRDTLRFKNVQIRFKSQAKRDNKNNENFAHSVWGVDKADPKTSLNQISQIRKAEKIFSDQL